MVNEQTGYPGPGAFSFVERYLQDGGKRKLETGDREACVEMALRLIYDYPKWNEVAAYFDVKIDSRHYDHRAEQPVLVPAPTEYRGGLESQEHKALKKWVSEHPASSLPHLPIL